MPIFMGIFKGFFRKYNDDEVTTMITYDPLWETLKKKNITTYQLLNDYHISRGMLDNLKHNRSITMATLNQLCNMLKCDVTDIIQYTKDEH